MKLKLHSNRLFKKAIITLLPLMVSQTITCQEEETVYCTFNTPIETVMPIMYYRSYNKSQGGSITVIGDNGPDLTHIRKLDIAYTNGEISTFLLNEWSEDQGFGGNGAFYYFDPDHTFDQINPSLTLSGTEIDNLDGSYYVTVIENEEFGENFADFVMVSQTGDFSIYFTYSENAPDCIDNFNDNEESVDYENIVYEESVDGNVSSNYTLPTIIELIPGDNRIISSQTLTVDQANFFTLQVPEGYQLSQLFVDNYEGADDIGFIGINEESLSFLSPTTPTSLLGGLSYGTANIGTDILPAMGDSDNPAAVAIISGFGFTPPLLGEEYAVWLNQTGDTSSSVLNFVVTAIDDVLSTGNNEIDNSIMLSKNYPNPFNEITTIQYELKKSTQVNLEIFNLKGQLVEFLNVGKQTLGNHEITFDLSSFSDGIYIYTLSTDEGTESGRMVLKK